VSWLLVVSLVAVLPGAVATAASGVSAVTFDQCANGAPGTVPTTACNDGWVNGTLNKQDSQYAEEQVVPQRIAVTVGNGKHSFQIGWEDRKGSAGAHAYDSLATWNHTEGTADGCQGLTESLCTGTASTLPIPLDPTEVPPSASGTSDVTSAHQLTGQEFVMYGGSLTAATNYSHSAASSPTTDDETTITVSYTTSGPSSQVVFLFGGHLAGSTEPGGWGSGFGSANINGGPYHVDFLAADGSSVGNRSNNIQASAILGPAAFTIAKSATPNPAAPGATVTYTITVTNDGASPGSTTFTDANDSRVTHISAVTTSPSGGSCVPESATPTTLDCTTSTINPGASQTFTYTAVMPTTFTSGSGTGGCPPGEFPVPNTATLANGGQVTFVECVTAAPNFTIQKTASPTVANPGQQVTYTIVVDNTGTAPGSTSFTDANDPNVTHVTFVGSSPSGGTCGPVSGTTNLSCTTSTISAGSSQTFTVTADMPTSFTGASGGGGCQPGQFPVIDTVTLTEGGSSGATVCVTASPAFTITKSASPTSATPGQQVTYTITVTNGGSASGSTGFTDTNDPTVTHVTFAGSTPNGGSCTLVSGTTNLTCTTSTINPGASQIFTVTADMPASFSGTSGTAPCGTNQFPVIDTVTLTGGGSSNATVCVTANPAFVINKTASPTTANPGQLVTYTITVTNDGTAPGSTGFTDTNDPTVTNVTFVGSSPKGGACSPVSGTTNLDCTTSRLKVGASQVFTVTANMPTSFTGSPGPGCGMNQFPVIDTVTLSNGGSSGATVCVTASPNLVLHKSANPTSTTPGGTVTYTITVANNGAAPGSTSFSDSSNPAPQSISTVTVSGGSGTCTETGTTINCLTGTLNPGQTETFTYTAVMPASFSGNPGGGGCGPNQFPVVNTVVPTTVTVSSTSTTVCVTATPNLTLAKSAAITDGSGHPISPPATTGDDIVYTLTYGNTGTADANNTVITDTVPAGTEFIGCSGGCVTSGNPASSVTWNIGTVPAGAVGRTVTLTVEIVSVTSCTITNTADISSPNFTPPGGQAGGQLPATAAVPSTPGPNPAGANASGTAIGAYVNVLGLVTTTIPSPPTHTAQGGIGNSAASASLVNVSVPMTPPTVLSANVVTTANDAKVVGGPDAAATDQATAETAGLCVLPVAGLCTVKADAVLANSQTTATATGASISSAGSTFVNLTVQGLAQVNVSPNTCIALPAGLFGPGSFVGLYVQSPSSGGALPTTCPPPGQTGTAGLTTINGVPAYAADLTVTMIDVHVTDLVGLGALDLAVSQATAHSDFPPLAAAGCPAGVTQSVSGHAFIAGEDTTPPIIPALVGYVSIPPSGGTDSQNLATVALFPSGTPPVPQVTAGAAVSKSTGALTSTASTADSEAQVAGVCILPVAGATGPPSSKTCTIYASVAKSVSSSGANAAGATSADTDTANGDLFGATELLNLAIGGNALTLPVTRNDAILPAGLPIAIILDQETCDNGTATSTGTCGGPGQTHSGLTVTAIHVILLGPLDGLPIGADIQVAQAHSDATFG
jgi:uncharacterized repeat protein (TIGR01451 family)